MQLTHTHTTGAMAAATGGTTTTLLRLKDLLELDCDSCSAAGFRCYPRRLLAESAAPVRHLLESSPSLRRRPSKLSHLSRSLSRSLSRRGGGFWRRRDDEAASASAACGGSSGSSEEPETSSSSESSDSSSGRRSRRSRSESDSDISSAATEDRSVHQRPYPLQSAAAAGDEREDEGAMKRVAKEGSTSTSASSESDDKEQLSPVAVMDFPFDDEDDEEEEEELTNAGDACSASFSLARLQRRKTHKIRRFGSHDDPPLVSLEALLAATSDLDDATDDDDDVPLPRQAPQQMTQCPTEAAATTPTCASNGHRPSAGVVDDDDVPDEDDGLISLLMGAVSAGLDGVSERLLLDFFVEATKRRRPEPHGADDGGEALVLAAARGWLEGTGTEGWGLKDVLGGGAAIVPEMERGRRWMQVAEEEREVGALVAGMLLDQLLDEVVVSCLFV